MATTARKLITSSLRLIGVLASGETALGDDANDGLVVLNDFVDELAAQRLSINATTRTEYPLTAAVSSYTIGVGGDLNQARPLWIPYAGLIIDNTETVPTEIGIDVYSVQQYADIFQKTLASAYVQAIYFDHAWSAGLGNIHVYPVPDIGTTNLVLYTPTAITEFAALDTAYTFPPGYRKMLRYNLAVQLAPEYGRQVDQVIFELAKSSLAIVKAANATQPGLMRVDSALVGRSGTWDWRTGNDHTRGSG